MADTMTIVLDNSDAIASLDNLVSGLGEAQSETLSLAEAGQQVIDSQTKQIIVIEKQSTEWKTFAMTATESMGQVATASLELAGDILHIEHAFQSFALDAGKKAIDTLFNIAEMTVKYTLIAKGATSVIGAVRGTQKAATEEIIKGTVAIEEHTSSLQKASIAAQLFGSSGVQAVARLAGLAGGVAVAIKAGDAFAETMKEVRDATEKSTGDFDRLKNAAAGAAYNLTRPFSEVGPSLSGILGGVKDDFSSWAKQIGDDAYKYFGVAEAVKYGEKNLDEWGTFFENWVDEARGNFVRFENSAVKAFGFKGDDNADRYVEEAKALRELADWHEKMDAKREKEAAGFKALGEANRQFEQQVKDRSRAEEIASLKTEEQVKTAILAQQRLAAERVQAGKVSPEEDAAHQKRLMIITQEWDAAMDAAKTKEQTAKAQSDRLIAIAKEEADYKALPAKKLLAELTALEQRRTQIVEEESQKRVAKEKESAEQIKQAYKSLADERIAQERATEQELARDGGASERELHEMRLRWIDEEAETKSAAAQSAGELIVIEAEAEKKRISEVEAFRRDSLKRAAAERQKYQDFLDAQSEASNEIEKARIEFANAMELQSLELKLQGQKNFAASSKKELEDERQRQLAAQQEIHQKRLDIIEEDTERAIKAAKTREAELQAIADGEKRRLREMADFEKSVAQEAHDHKMKLAEEEQRKKDEAKKAQIENLKPVAEQIIGMQTPQQRLRELQNLRAQQARDKAISDAGFTNGEEIPPEVRRAAQQAEQRARRQALVDSQRGNVSQEDQAAVATNLANRAIGQMAKNGQLQGDVIGTQQQAVQVMAQQQANTDALKNQVNQVQNALNTLRAASDPGRFRAGAGGLKGG